MAKARLTTEPVRTDWPREGPAREDYGKYVMCHNWLITFDWVALLGLGYESQPRCEVTTLLAIALSAMQRGGRLSTTTGPVGRRLACLGRATSGHQPFLWHGN
jgi:hypothetical protein